MRESYRKKSRSKRRTEDQGSVWEEKRGEHKGERWEWKKKTEKRNKKKQPRENHLSARKLQFLVCKVNGSFLVKQKRQKTTLLIYLSGSERWPNSRVYSSVKLWTPSASGEIRAIEACFTCQAGRSGETTITADPHSVLRKLLIFHVNKEGCGDRPNLCWHTLCYFTGWRP